MNYTAVRKHVTLLIVVKKAKVKRLITIPSYVSGAYIVILMYVHTFIPIDLRRCKALAFGPLYLSF